MRLKSAEGPLSVYNGNPDVINSPKRNNTVQNSNLAVRAIYNNSNLSSSHYVSSNDNCNLVRIVGTERDDNITNSEHTEQWYSSATARGPFHAISDNTQNRKQLFNIDSTLAVSLENARQVRALSTSIYSESSPDDSLLDYEDVHQSCTSSDSSPQDEDRIFDISDCESPSEDVNLSNSGSAVCKRRGIVNPNYPGFQHFAHTLDYSIKASSDTDLTDDDEFESEYVTETNNINNNNNNNNNNNIEREASECRSDKIDGVNRLDSDENTQKVFYDKDVFNISLQTGGNDYQESLLSSEKVNINNNFPLAGEESGQLSQLVQIDLERAAEKLTAAEDLQPTAAKYEYEPNVEEPFNKTRFDDSLDMKVPVGVVRAFPEESLKLKFSDAFLSDVQDCIPVFYSEKVSDENLNDFKLGAMEFDVSDKPMLFDNDLADIDSYRQQKKVYDRSAFSQNKIIASAAADQNDDAEKFCKEDKTKDEPEKDEDSAVPRKKEKIEVAATTNVRDNQQHIGATPQIAAPRREHAGGKCRENYNRHTIPGMRETKATNSEFFGGFDVYNIETAMPKIDLEAIEWHLRAAREEERRRRTDREEIRKRLAMGSEDDHYNHLDRPGRKPSLQARLQSGMNLQICFMNETVSDGESPNSDTESATTNPKSKPSRSKIRSADQEQEKRLHAVRPASLAIGQSLLHRASVSSQPMTESDFFARQGRLQTEARMALAQAKEMARMQMEIERQRQEKSPIAEMVRHSLEKVGIPFPEDRRRLSRQILTEMNLAQLQVIVNDLHSQIETLNENLVKFLMHRDDLHMEQDSMLVDIEDLTRYLGAKEQSFKEQNLNQNQTTVQHNNNISQPPSPAPSALSLPILNGGGGGFIPLKPHFHTIGNLLKN